MKIQTINVNKLLTHFGRITKYIKERDPDIECLQETKCTDEEHLYNLLDKEVNGITYINSKLSKHGVAIIQEDLDTARMSGSNAYIVQLIRIVQYRE